MSSTDREIWRGAAAKCLAGVDDGAPLSAEAALAAAQVIGRVWHVAPVAVPLFLRRFGSVLPMTTVLELEALAEASHAQGCLFRKVAREAIDAFAAEKLPLVALKGTAVGYACYEDPAMRSGADLDFCVWPKDVPQAKEILSSLGFRAMEYLPAERRFEPADPKARAELEAGHYELGFWVRIERFRSLTAKTLEGFRLGAPLLAAASRIEGDDVLVPVIVDIHHALSLDIPADGVMEGASLRSVSGGQCLLPPLEWMALHAILKLYWEGGQTYGSGFQNFADIVRIVRLLDDSQSEALAGLLENWDLCAGGYYVLRRVVACDPAAIREPLAGRLDKWSTPPAGETPQSYNDIGDFWPRMFGTL